MTQVRDLFNLLYRIRLIGYGTAELTLHPEILLQTLYYNEVNAHIDKFKSYVFGEILWTDSYKFCYGAGWGTQKIIMAIDMAMTFKDCYKTLIDTLADLGDAWTSRNAKLID